MPRENRKRGKKHKKKPDEDTYVQPEEHPLQHEEEQAEAAGPSWIVPAREDPGVDLNAPFGYVDAEVKAYFRTVDVQIREWQETKPEVETDEDVDPNEGASSITAAGEHTPKNAYRPPTLLRGCTSRNVWEGEAACDGPRLLDYPRKNDTFHG